jgi:LysM repeat protein
MKVTNPALLLLLAAGLIGGCASTQPKEESGPASAAAETKGAPAEQAQATKSSDTYNVVRGDNLWNISGKPVIYGNPYEWPLIFKANRDKIRDADLIEPGQVFSIDRNASAADVDAAVQHAKTRGAWKLGVTEQSDLAYLAKYGMK